MGLRYLHSKNLADLDRMIHLLKQALEEHQPEMPGRALLMKSLGKAFRIRYEETKDLEDLERAHHLLE